MSAPIPAIREENPNNNTKTIFLELDQKNLYQIDFTILNREIQIKCQNTSINSMNIYSYDINLDDLKFITYKDINQIYLLIKNSIVAPKEILIMTLN